MVKYLLPILLCILHEPILSIDLNIYPKIIERNDNNKGEFQAYVSGMDEIIQMTLKNGNEIININFEKIIISDCQIFEFEKECKQSLIGCQWSSKNQIVNQVYLDVNGLLINVFLQLNVINYLQLFVKIQLML